jgi:glutamate carboxypeptidase
LHRQSEYGDLLEASFGPRRSVNAAPLLLLGHLDTVWEIGTIRSMPWNQDGNRVSGPGVLDMKCGVVMALTALQILQEHKALSRPIRLLLHSDEEIGSPVSRAVTEKIARQCEAVYVLEPAQGEQGAYKTARKGVCNYRLEITGIAAHSGVDFSAGHSAVAELARQIQRISGFTDLKSGITVNPGVIGGGTRSNVIAANAWTEVDVRIEKTQDLARIERAFRQLRASDPGCKLQVSGGINRPPMERTKGTAALFRRAQKLASLLGFPLQEASTGGGSDGNFTSHARWHGRSRRRRARCTRAHPGRVFGSQDGSAGCNDVTGRTLDAADQSTIVASPLPEIELMPPDLDHPLLPKLLHSRGSPSA